MMNDTWVPAEGEPMRLGSLRGRPVLITMFFSHCDAACPLIVARMKKIEGLLEHPGRVRFVLVSLDVERDDPDRLRGFRDRMGLAPERWTLLHGDEGAVRGLAAALGIRYRREDDGGFSHSNVIQLLDEEGRPSLRLDGLEADPAAVLRHLE